MLMACTRRHTNTLTHPLVKVWLDRSKDNPSRSSRGHWRRSLGVFWECQRDDKEGYICSSQYFFLSCAVKIQQFEGRGNYVSIRHSLKHTSFYPSSSSRNHWSSVPGFPNFAYLIFAAYFFATGGGYDKLEVYKCSNGVKAPAVTREMVIRFPSCMVSWRHKEFHMVIQMLHLNLLLVSTPELSTSTELVKRLLSIWGSRQRKSYVLHGNNGGVY